MSTTPLENIFIDVANKIESIRKDLVVADAVVLSERSSVARIIESLRAFSYVWLAAALQLYLEQLPEALIGCMSNGSVLVSDVKPSIHSLIFRNEFQSARDCKRENAFEKRIFILKNSHANTLLEVDPGSRFDWLFGKIPSEVHFRRLWDIFSFDGDYFPSPNHKYRLAIKELHEIRDNLAHGKIDPEAVYRLKSYKDVLEFISNLDAIILHVHLTSVDYVDTKKYLK